MFPMNTSTFHKLKLVEFLKSLGEHVQQIQPIALRDAFAFTLRLHIESLFAYHFSVRRLSIINFRKL